MSTEENKNEQEAQQKQQDFKMGDDLIAVVRELIQLTILTGTNIVDHLRAVSITQDEETGKLIPTPEYVQAYEQMIVELNRQAQEAQEESNKKQNMEELLTAENGEENSSDDLN